MTLIEDMSETQRQAWITLLVDCAVFIYFVGKMTFGRTIETLSAAGLGKIMLTIIIFTIVAHIIIHSVFGARLATKNLEEGGLKDERDVRIERKGNSYGFHVLAAFVYVLIFQILLQNGLDGVPNTGADYGYKSWFDYTNTTHLVFGLASAAFIADIVKNLVMILAYRGHG